MNQDFAILPWEHRGANFNPTPHAQTTLEVEGQKREILLKMRDGLIYFKDPNRAPTFAIIRHFETELHGNDLISAWRREMERENFGRCYARTVHFQDCPGTTVVISIIRSDFSGWISDAFHLDWHEIPRHRDGKTLNIWKDSIREPTWRAILKVRDALRDRPMPASECQPVPSRWPIGDEDQLRRIFAIIMRLYVRRDGGDSSRTWNFAATNIASPGGWRGSFGPLSNLDLRISLRLPSLLRLIEQYFVWIAMEWQHYNRSTFHAPQHDNAWRGRYGLKTPSINITVPLVASLSHHQKLELLLQLRDWLEGKVSPRQSATWLAGALD